MCKKPRPTHRRPNRWHDETKRCIYHITLVVNDRDMVLGRIVGNSADDARCEASPLGIAVSRCINNIPYFGKLRNRDLQILAASVMPEHIHFCLYVKRDMDCKLGEIIKGFKQGCNKALRAEIERQTLAAQNKGDCSDRENRQHSLANETLATFGQDKPKISDRENSCQPLASSNSQTFLPVVSDGAYSAPTFPSATEQSQAIVRAAVNLHSEKTIRITSPKLLNDHRLFDDDFDRTPLIRKGQLQNMIDYVHNNAKHRWLKQQHKDLLMPIRGIMIAGRSYDAIGNVNLLGLPRYQVHSRYLWDKYNNTAAIEGHQQACMEKAKNNYAMVSPFVNPHEAKVRDWCLQEGHSVIVLTDNGFTEFTQCPGGLYDYCVNGQVLVLVPSDWPHIDNKAITRPECKMLNGFAEEIVNESERVE